MELMQAMRGRRSVRRFLDTPVPAELLPVLAEALAWAPSAGNEQSRYFIFVTDTELRRSVAAACTQRFVATAPLLLVACADRRLRKQYGARGAEEYTLLDAAAALQNYLLAAHAAGLATCWVASFRAQALRSALRLPHHLRPVAVVPTGYAGEQPSAPPRRAVAELMDFR